MGAPGPEEQYYQEQERRENDRVKREEAREREERENRQREEQREQNREKREEQARVGEHQLARVHAPESFGFSAGGGPSFLLNITEGLTLAPETAKEEPTEKGFASIRYTPAVVNLMKDKSVAPGSVWEIYGIYLKIVPQMFVILTAPDPKNAVGTIALTATMFRNTHPIWIQTASIQPHFLKSEPLAGQFSFSSAPQTLALGVEFTSAVILGPGEGLSLELNYEGQAAWENTSIALDAALNTNFPGIGSIRYNIRPHGPNQ